MSKQNKTIVIFRKFNDGEIIALFPFEEWSNGCCVSYMHIGQHSGADYNHVITTTKPATKSEYKDLFNELKRVGYNNLRVLQRKPNYKH